MEWIEIKHATQNNLKNISVNILKATNCCYWTFGFRKVLLSIDTLAAESRRELNDTFSSFVQITYPNMVVQKLKKSRIFLLQLSLTRKSSR